MGEESARFLDDDAFFTEGVGRAFRVFVEGKCLYVSKEALALCSNVFPKMLFGTFKEAKEDFVELKEKKLKDALTVFHYLFPIKPYTDMDLNNVLVLMKFADEYDCEKMKRDCQKFLDVQCSKLEVGNENVLKIIQVASKFSLMDMVVKCIPYVCALPTERFKSVIPFLQPNVVLAVYDAKVNRSMKMVHVPVGHTFSGLCTGCEKRSPLVCAYCRLLICNQCSMTYCPSVHKPNCNYNISSLEPDGSAKCLCGFTFNKNSLFD